MKDYRYSIFNVFTDSAAAGNPLAVVFNADGLDGETMQRIAHDFDLSETVFVLPPDIRRHRARIRIFTPSLEMPFAGHPTVGAAVALREPGESAAQRFVLEELIGPVRCAVWGEAKPAFAEFDLPRLPEPVSFGGQAEAVAKALGLQAADIGFENHRVTCWSAGVPYVCVPVRSVEALGRARQDNPLWVDLADRSSRARRPAAFLYCRGTTEDFRARMFAGHLGLPEDPATGSAAAAFAGVVKQFEGLGDGTTRIWIGQGVEMGRPSRIRLELDMADGALERARIGGHALKVSEGTVAA